MLLQSAKLIAAGLATISLAGSGVGIGIVLFSNKFGSFGLFFLCLFFFIFYWRYFKKEAYKFRFFFSLFFFIIFYNCFLTDVAYCAKIGVEDMENALHITSQKPSSLAVDTALLNNGRVINVVETTRGISQSSIIACTNNNHSCSGLRRQVFASLIEIHNQKVG
jgi:hypothetical protein